MTTKTKAQVVEESPEESEEYSQYNIENIHIENHSTGTIKVIIKMFGKPVPPPPPPHGGNP